MGSGKTTLGEALSRLSGRPFVDLDQYIEATNSLSVTDIFARYGEDGFRRLETEALDRLARQPGIIVACGGGTPCFGSNMELMNRMGLTVWLQSSPRVLFDRLAVARAKRPLIADMDDDALYNFIVASLQARAPHYARAAATFDTNPLDDPQAIDTTAQAFINRFL